MKGLLGSNRRRIGSERPRSRGSRRTSPATALLSALLAVGFGAVPLAVVSQPAQAAPVALQSGELVVNGTAESGNTTGWTGGLMTAPYGTSQTTGYPPAIVIDKNGAIVRTFDGGSRLFSGTGGSSTASQTISLAPSAAAIDNGNVTARLSVYIGGYYTQTDRMTVVYEFRDAAGAVVRQVQYGPVTRADRNGRSGFNHFAGDLLLPVGTRSARITLSTVRDTGPDNDGYADNVSLILDAPLPDAQPDTITTDDATAVTIDPLANDAAGSGATLDPTSVWLEDADGTRVRSLTTVAGEYVVNAATGVIEFTPTPGFGGDGPELTYHVTDTSGQPGSSTIATTVTRRLHPAITLVKGVTPPGSPTAGQPVTFTLEAENTGDARLQDVTIEDDTTQFTGNGALGALRCTPAQPATLDPGEKLRCTAEYALVQADIDRGEVVNRAEVHGTAPGGEVVTDDAETTLAIDAAAAIGLVKTVDTRGASKAGDVVHYRFEVTNTGNLTLSQARIREGQFDGSGSLGGLDCPKTAFAPGKSVTCTAAYTVTQQDVDRGLVGNTASATADAVRGPDPQSDQSGTSFTLTPAPALSLVKAASPQDAAAFRVGQQVDYSFTVTNTGNVTINGIRIDEGAFDGSGPLTPVTCPVDVLSPGERTVCHAGYTIRQQDVDRGILSNTATATGTPPGGGAPVVSPSATIRLPADRRPEIALVKTADTSLVTKAGETIGYRFRVTNTGNVSVSDVRIAEGAFSGTGELTEPVCPQLPDRGLAPGQETVCEATYRVRADDLTGADLTNTATAVATSGPDDLESPASTAVVDTREAPAVDPDPELPRTGSNLSVALLALVALVLGSGAVLLARTHD